MKKRCNCDACILRREEDALEIREEMNLPATLPIGATPIRYNSDIPESMRDDRGADW
jgi:hypothetical protein